MLQRTALALALAMTATSLVSCKPNEAATNVCKPKAKSSDDCSSCCKGEGASGHKWVNGDCSCLGG